jgi:hypothetical protein
MAVPVEVTTFDLDDLLARIDRIPNRRKNPPSHTLVPWQAVPADQETSSRPVA